MTWRHANITYVITLETWSQSCVVGNLNLFPPTLWWYFQWWFQLPPFFIMMNSDVDVCSAYYWSHVPNHVSCLKWSRDPVRTEVAPPHGLSRYYRICPCVIVTQKSGTYTFYCTYVDMVPEELVCIVYYLSVRLSGQVQPSLLQSSIVLYFYGQLRILYVFLCFMIFWIFC